MRSDKACVQCHDSGQYATEKHTHHNATSTGSRCADCHMPHTNYGLLKAARTHSISSPSVRRNLETSRPNACNLCHLGQDHVLDGESLERLVRHGFPKLEKPWTDTAASIVGALRGDASVRALTAWHYGWKPAQDASDAGQWGTTNPHSLDG